MGGGPRLEAGVLGPALVAGSDGTPIRLDRPLERALAIRLALAAGAVVTDDTLVAALWGDGDLARPGARLRVLSSRLRGALGAYGAALRRSSGGFALDAAAVDLRACEELLATVHAAHRRDDVATVRDAASRALALWRGDALADLRTVPFAQREGERLDAIRDELRGERLAAEVELGATAEVRTQLQQLVRERPLDERFAGLLARALYQDGRQAEALAVLAELRARLAAELGVDPAPETTALEVRLLRHDRELDPRAGRPAGYLPQPRLRSPVGPFLGRDAERVALSAQLAEPALITLTGPPGSGKTRLALEIARIDHAAGRPVAWTDLSPLLDASGVAGAVSSACAVDAGPDLIGRLASVLRGALLVIDNAEHLVDTTAELVDALRAEGVPVSILVTSQRPLLVSGEEVHHLEPLSPSAAAQLFCQRSGTARDEDVDTICAAVDLLPLGVELAAGLTRTLTVPQIAARVDDRLRLLVGGARDFGGRHASLRGTLDWSYRLLDDVGAAVLRRLAVFAGGCTLEMAEAVVADDDVPRSAVATALADLDERCLLSVSGRGAAPRFDLLDTVRAYATDRLAGDCDENERIRARHLAWCREHVAAHDVQGADQPGALAAIFAEWPNLAQALDSAPSTARAADALRLALALDDAWMFRGMQDQARRHYAALVEAPGVTDGERARALSNYAFASTLVGAHARVTDLLERAAQLAEAAGDTELRMRVLYHRGIALVEDGRPLAALEPLKAGGELAQQLGRDRAVSAFHDVTGTAMLYAGHAAEAALLHAQANDSDRRTGSVHGLVRGLVNEASAHVALGDYDEARRCADEGIGHAVELGDLVAEAMLRSVFGHAALAEGDPATAVAAFRAALTSLTPGEIDAHLCRLDLADALLHAGKIAEARCAVDEAMDNIRHHGVVWLLAQPTLAQLAAIAGDPESAEQILAAAESEYADRDFDWPLARRRLEHARRVLGS